MLENENKQEQEKPVKPSLIMLGKEITAIARISEALHELPPDVQLRVLRWVLTRLEMPE